MKEKYMKDFNGEKIFCLEYDKETLRDMVIARQEEIECLQEKINKAIEYLKQECLYDGKTYCDDLWCGDIPKLVTLLKGSDKE